jgi:FkbM family methyltransferase
VKTIRARVAERLGSDRYSWPALNGLDRTMVGLLPEDGTFLEVGGNDGYSQSNTYYLERHKGWSGILIEPLPSLADRCRKLRTMSVCYNLACVSPESAGIPISIANMDLMSVALRRQDADCKNGGLNRSDVSPIVNVSTSTISAVIDHSPYSEITFMSIDVEGAELELLAGLDINRHAPRYLLVETKQAALVARALGDRMKLREQLTHHDYLFERLAV